MIEDLDQSLNKKKTGPVRVSPESQLEDRSVPYSKLQLSGKVSGTDISDGAINNAKVASDAAIDISKTALLFERQDINANSVVSTTKIQYGWGYLQGNNTTQIGVTITFPIAFATAPIVVCQIAAGYYTSAPTAVSDSYSAIEGVQQGLNVNWANISLAQVQLYINRVNNNFASGRYYVYSW